MRPWYYYGSIGVVKLSVSLSDEDVAVLDAYVEKIGLTSRSAGLQRAIRMLRYPTLEDDYDGAWSEWASTGEAEVWDDTASDGLDHAAGEIWQVDFGPAEVAKPPNADRL